MIRTLKLGHVSVAKRRYRIVAGSGVEIPGGSSSRRLTWRAEAEDVVVRNRPILKCTTSLKTVELQ